MRESLYNQVIFWTILSTYHIDSNVILPRYEGCGWYIDPNGLKNKNILKYLYPTCIKKKAVKPSLHITKWYQKG